MADNELQQTFLENGDLPLVRELSDVKFSSELQNKSFERVSSSDILQRAFDEVENFDQSLLIRSDATQHILETDQHMTDQSEIHTSTSSSVVTSSHSLNSSCCENGKVTNISNLQFSNIVDCENSDSKSLFIPKNISVSSTEVEKESLLIEKDENTSTPDTVIVNSTPINSTDPTPSTSFSVESSNIKRSLHCVSNKKAESIPSDAIFSPINVSTSKLSAKQTDAPLGSVENPIQIIHNGRSFHSNQVLTQAQLHQITHVFQQSQARRLANEGSSVSFEPNTKTRIVCRVVHPSELQKKITKQETLRSLLSSKVASSSTASTVGSSSAGNVAGRGRGRPKKSYGKRDDDKNSLLSKEEKEEKKKHCPRTRSGRISKPPSYMIKDYKRLHHLNFNDEVDDQSDGGYSDYHVSDDEIEKRGDKSDKPPAGVTTAKSRMNKCPSCNKAYIGRSGLSRHYQICHARGNLHAQSNKRDGGDIGTQEENSNSSIASSVLSSSGGNTNSQTNLLAGANPVRQDVEISTTVPETSTNQTDHLLDRRKEKLKEVLNTFSTSELIEALLPKFVQEVPLWNFFTSKCHKESNGLSIFEMLKEFEKFLVHMQKISLSCLSPATEADQGKTIINISSKQIAEALSLERGSYAVNDNGVVALHLKSNTVSSSSSNVLPKPQLEPSDNMLLPYAKRKRVDSSAVDVNAGLPEQILSESHENNSFDSTLSRDIISETANINLPQIHFLNANSTKESPDDSIQKNLFDLKSSTIVTPSSLSTGCLSAIDSSNFQKGQTFMVQNDMAPIQSMQVKKVRILNTFQNHVLNTVDNISSMNGYSVSSDCNLSDLATQAQLKDISVKQNQEELNKNKIENKTYQPLILNPTASLFNPCAVLSQGNVVNSHQTSNCDQRASFANALQINGCFKTDLQKISATSKVSENLSNSFVPDLAQSLENSLTSVSDSDVQTCIPIDGIPSSTHAETSFQIAPTEIMSTDVIKSVEPTVLQQLLLPNGQVIGVWSAVESSGKTTGEQMVQEYLPGNLIIVQSSDSIQVPQNQSTNLENLQALTTVVSTAPELASSLTYTTVNI